MQFLAPPLSPLLVRQSPSQDIRFDTEFSQELQQHKQHRDFSPWVGGRQPEVQEDSIRRTNYHRFLETINTSPRNRKVSKKGQRGDGDSQLAMLRADLEEKINAEKTVSRLQFHQNMRGEEYGCRSFLQSRRNFRKICRKPNSIDLIFEKGIYSLGRELGSTEFNHSERMSRSPDLKKPQQKSPTWARRRKQSIDSIKHLAQTMKEFRVGTLQNVKRMLNLGKGRQGSPSKDLFQTNQSPKLKKLFQIKQKPKQATEMSSRCEAGVDESMGCFGKSAFSGAAHKTCRERVRIQFKSQGRVRQNQLLLI